MRKRLWRRRRRSNKQIDLATARVRALRAEIVAEQKEKEKVLPEISHDRARKALTTYGITNLDQVCDLTEEDLLKIPWIGLTLVAEIKHSLHRIGRTLAPSPPSTKKRRRQSSVLEQQPFPGEETELHLVIPAQLDAELREQADRHRMSLELFCRRALQFACRELWRRETD